MERTTDLTQLKNGSSFTWGRLIKIHEFAEYAIVEFHPFIYESNCSTHKVDTTKKEYSIYCNGKSASRSCENMDSAIVECIAYKHEGANTHAGAYFMRMLKEDK